MGRPFKPSLDFIGKPDFRDLTCASHDASKPTITFYSLKHQYSALHLSCQIEDGFVQTKKLAGGIEPGGIYSVLVKLGKDQRIHGL